MASGWSPIASHQINVSLEPGETTSFVFVLGYVENPEDDKWESYGVINKKPADAMLAKYQTDADVEKAFADLKQYWDGLLSKYTVKSSNEKVDRMVNIWNQYQCMVTFNVSAPLLTMNPALEGAWDLETPVRICWASYT